MQNDHHNRFLKSLNSIMKNLSDKKMENSIAIRVYKYAYFQIVPAKMSVGS